MNVSIKFDIDPLGSLSGNAQRPKSVTDRRTKGRTSLFLQPPPTLLVGDKKKNNIRSKQNRQILYISS